MTIGSRSSRRSSPRRRRSRRQMNAGCAGSMVYMIAVVGDSLVLSIAALFMANDTFAFVKADAVEGDHGFGEHLGILARRGAVTAQGVINYHSVFKLYLTLKHQTDTSVLAGAYQLNPSMDYGQIVDALANTASTETVLRIYHPGRELLHLADPSGAAGQRHLHRGCAG